MVLIINLVQDKRYCKLILRNANVNLIGNLVMTVEITSHQIIDKVKNQLGLFWEKSFADDINTAYPDTRVPGIDISYTPSIEWISDIEPFWIPWHM